MRNKQFLYLNRFMCTADVRKDQNFSSFLSAGVKQLRKKLMNFSLSLQLLCIVVSGAVKMTLVQFISQKLILDELPIAS